MAIEVEDPAQAAATGEPEATPEPVKAPGNPQSLVVPAPVKGLAVSDPQDASKAGAIEGTVFIKNRVNEIIQLPGGGTYQFKRTREVVSDPKLVKKLRQVADKYQIIIES